MGKSFYRLEGENVQPIFEIRQRKKNRINLFKEIVSTYVTINQLLFYSEILSELKAEEIKDFLKLKTESKKCVPTVFDNNKLKLYS